MKHCLVVDDSRVVRKVARKILEELKFEISEAEDGAIALAACRSGMPDAILLDWNMPNMSGIEFLKALRQETGGDKPPENDPSWMVTEEARTFMRGSAQSWADAHIASGEDPETAHRMAANTAKFYTGG